MKVWIFHKDDVNELYVCPAIVVRGFVFFRAPPGRGRILACAGRYRKTHRYRDQRFEIDDIPTPKGTL